MSTDTIARRERLDGAVGIHSFRRGHAWEFENTMRRASMAIRESTTVAFHSCKCRCCSYRLANLCPLRPLFLTYFAPASTFPLCRGA